MKPFRRACITLFVCVPIAAADEYLIEFDKAPTSHYIDRWVYPFNVTPGARIQAPTFGAIGSEGFDDRDGQFLIAVDTEAIGIPKGMSPSQYDVDFVRLTLTESVGGYRFDGTYDTFGTYLDSGSENSHPDADAGRPIELYGAGFRNGFERFGFPDGSTATDAPIFSAASPFGPSDRGTRNVFAADAKGRDVSNNVDSVNNALDAFDVKPFAIGQAFSGDTLVPSGQEVDTGTTFQFDIDVSEPNILDYVRQGLSAGQLGFVITSMNSTGQQGAGDPFVNLATANHFATAGPQMQLGVSVSDTILGDFDGDGFLTDADIDRLAIAIANGSSAAEFDVNADSFVDMTDHGVWVEKLVGTYYGDANLDGEFNSSDFVAVFTAGEYEDFVLENSTWATGDWNGDREFDTKDFVLAFQSSGYEKGPRPNAVVPEPSSRFAVVAGIICIAMRRNSRVVNDVYCSRRMR